MKAETWQTTTLGNFFTAQHGHDLTPRGCIGAEDVEDHGESFGEKMQRPAAQLNERFAESRKLEKAIRANLEGLGYGEK